MNATKITAEPGLPYIDMSREFDAPRDVLYRAYTEPDLLVRWLGPRRMTMVLDRWDVRDGGAWRYIHRDKAGNEFGFHGVFHGTPTPSGWSRRSSSKGRPATSRSRR